AAGNELDKLFAYVSGREAITAADVDAIVTVHLETRVFDLVEAVARGQRRRSLELYYGLLSLHEAPGRILYYIGRQFHQMLIASSMREKRASMQEIMQALNVSDYVVRKIVDQARRFTVDEIKTCIDRCVSLEADYKRGDLTDTLAVELFIFELTEQRKRSPQDGFYTN
ncbi:MAG: DNA polymerase III subunit delta, partial [Lachnospiraceae bacterium]|nr:DNA polymerase III subunit delta [Lachnospiraceae bacterium]